MEHVRLDQRPKNLISNYDLRECTCSPGLQFHHLLCLVLVASYLRSKHYIIPRLRYTLVCDPHPSQASNTRQNLFQRTIPSDLRAQKKGVRNAQSVAKCPHVPWYEENQRILSRDRNRQSGRRRRVSIPGQGKNERRRHRSAFALHSPSSARARRSPDGARMPVVSEGSLNDLIARTVGVAFRTVKFIHVSISWSVDRACGQCGSR